jgi:hypothetical protein
VRIAAAALSGDERGQQCHSGQRNIKSVRRFSCFIVQGSLTVATCVIVNGTFGSGFKSPALICACAAVNTSVSSAGFRSAS